MSRHPALHGCGLYRLSKTYELDGCSTGAILVGGPRTKIRRVRILDFGTETINNECFPMSMALAEPRMPGVRNCEISDCTAERPSPNNVRETTILSFGSQEWDDYGEPPAGQPSLRGVMAYHRSCAMRRNMVDCDYSVEQRQIKAMRYVGTSATATTLQPHNRKVGDWMVISGALVMDLPFSQGTVINPFNGSFQVTSVPSAYEFSYTMPAVPSAEPTGTMWLGRFPSVPIQIIAITQSTTAPWIITVTTDRPHFRFPGQNVRIENLKKQSIPNDNSLLAGPQRVIDVPAPNIFRFEVPTNPQGDWALGSTFFHVFVQGLSFDGGTGALGERNRIFGAFSAGPYHDTWHTKDLITQKNYYYDIAYGPTQNMGGISAVPPNDPRKRYATTLVRIGADNKTAKVTTPFRHGLSAGQVVRIDNARIGGALNPIFNGFFAVETVLTPYAFTYTLQQDPGGDADTENPPIFGALWQVGRIVCNRNIIQLMSNPLPNVSPTIGIAAGSGTDVRPYFVFLETQALRNIIRSPDSEDDAGPYAASIHWGHKILAQRNIASGTRPRGFGYHNVDVSSLRQFNNQTFEGHVIQAALLVFSPQFSSTQLNQLETTLDLGMAAQHTDNGNDL